jgi:hypothetical protein
VSVTRLPPGLNLVMYAGDDFPFYVEAQYPNGDPWPLEGELLAQIRRRRSDDDVLTEFEIDTTDADEGIVYLSLTGEQTADLIPSGLESFTGVWDLEWVKTPTTDPVTLFQGTVRCNLDVTREEGP